MKRGNSILYYNECSDAYAYTRHSPSMRPKLFWTVQIIMVEYQSFCTNPIHFGQIQNILDRPKLKKIVQKSLIEPDKNDLDPTKTICTRPKQFGLSKIILDLQKDKTQVAKKLIPPLFSKRVELTLYEMQIGAFG